MCVKDIVRLRSPVEHVRAGWRKGLDWMGSIQRVATLREPLGLAELRDAGVSSKSLQGRPEVTGQWRTLRTAIVDRNPDVDEHLPVLESERGVPRRSQPRR
jgi:hypothetical protein